MEIEIIDFGEQVTIISNAFLLTVHGNTGKQTLKPSSFKAYSVDIINIKGRDWIFRGFVVCIYGCNIS